ncbi:MAG: hypothetical protein HC884_18675 [Chloroflexaceae bacterium]|nr:hypothetical protein [Chloroflexaceae bacterium]
MTRQKLPPWQNEPGGRDPEPGSRAHDELMTAFVQRQVVADPVDSLHPPCVFFAPWEYTIHLEVPIRRHERIIGFADMVVTATRSLCCPLTIEHGQLRRPVADCVGGDDPYRCCQDAAWPAPSRRREPHGRVQVPDRLAVLLEFKTRVASVGELLRQMNTYRTSPTLPTIMSWLCRASARSAGCSRLIPMCIMA